MLYLSSAPLKCITTFQNSVDNFEMAQNMLNFCFGYPAPLKKQPWFIFPALRDLSCQGFKLDS